MKLSFLDDVKKTATESTIDFLKEDVIPKDNRSIAEIAVVGDPPDIYECNEKTPFSGINYKQFNRLSAILKLPKHAMYLTNCIKAKYVRSRGKDLSKYPKLWKSKGYRCAEWGKLQDKLISELELYQGKIIICMGDTATRLLIDDANITSVNKYRGSVFKAEEFYHLKDRLKGKIICITHSVDDCSPRMRPINFYILLNDFTKFIALNDYPEVLDIIPILHVDPTFDDVINFFDRVDKVNYTAVDIEATPKYVTCFSLTVSETEGMCIPLMNNQGSMWTASQEVIIWNRFSKIMNNPNIGKIKQNGMFDCMYLLRTLGIKCCNFVFDTMIAQHICWTDLPKGLDFLVSIYSYFPYYKDDGKQSHLTAIKDWKKYWNYNCKDAVYTHFIAKELMKELDKFDAWKDFEYMMELHAPLMEMEWNGILTEPEGIKKEKIRLERKLRALQHGINKIAKQELNFNSSKQMCDYFYDHCMIKPYINRKSGRYTCDVVALSRIAKKNVRGSHEAKMIIKYRKIHKLISTYFDIPVDADNKLRCTHKICGTISGRISTEQTYFGTGANLQNQPKSFKKFLRAIPGYILIELDLAKAEAHCVAFLSQDANMIHAFESGVDIHTFNASKIFNIHMSDVTGFQRQMGKKVVHASNYAMGPQTFSDNLAKDGIFMSKSECAKLLKAYNNRFPGLSRWQDSIKTEVSSNRILYNMFGRPKRFLAMMDDSLFRNAYSYIPQSTVAELLNRGMIKMYKDPLFNVPAFEMKMCVTVHDSVGIMTPIKNAKYMPELLRQINLHMHHEFTHKGRTFAIGLDAKIGTYWGKGMIEIPNFSDDAVYGACKELGFM